jgi:hypothetical protein
VRWALVAVVCGCSFEHGVVLNRGDASVGTDADADAIVDSPDAEPLCKVDVSSTTGVDRGRVGGDGGSANFPPLVCATAGDQMVGVALRMSDQDTIFGQRSAQGIRIGCAAVVVPLSGAGTTGTVTTTELLGTGGSGWAPSTWTPMTQCKPGWIISGMSAHTTDDGNLFLDASITCSQIGPTGKPVATETIYVDGSLDENNGSDAVQCNEGEVVVRMPNRSGAGLDSVNLWCTTPTCH